MKIEPFEPTSDPAQNAMLYPYWNPAQKRRIYNCIRGFQKQAEKIDLNPARLSRGKLSPSQVSVQ
jgi:hypothetical protein